MPAPPRFAPAPPGRPRNPEATTLDGVVLRMTFVQKEGDFAVARLQPDEGPEAVAVGRLAALASGVRVRLGGRWAEDPKWGWQFRAEACAPIPPSSLRGLRRYLGSGVVRGIGPALAERLADHFGERLRTVLDESPELLAEVSGIGEAKLTAIRAAWAEQRFAREVAIFLEEHGIGAAMARRIFRAFGDRAADVVRNDPYALAVEVSGIGFATADRIARSVGIGADSPRRVEAAVLHLLGARASDGHCFVPVAELVADGRKLLTLPEADVPAAIAELVRARKAEADDLPAQPDSDGPVAAVALRHLALAERSAAASLARLLAEPPRIGTGDPDVAVDRWQELAGVRLAEAQRQAVRAAVAENVLVVTGGPGTGKTTIVSAIVDLFEGSGAEVVLASPTGRAARRLSETTGRPASTLHRLLRLVPADAEADEDAEPAGAASPVRADLVVVDEVSMVDLPLFASLLRAIPRGCRLVLVGDADQLPSVGPGRVLADLLDSRAVPAVRLTEVFRQAAESRIVRSAHDVRMGRTPTGGSSAEGGDFFVIAREEPEAILELLPQIVAERIPKRFGLDPLADVQVLTPMNRGPLGSRALGERLQKELNPGTGGVLADGRAFRAGDKVIQLRNDYDKEVWNGDVGRILAADPATRRLEVRFDDRRLVYEAEELDDLAPAYALTVHKSQGSEYPAVVLVLHGQHFPLLQRNLVYTAITRARKLCVVLGSPRALARAVANDRSERRGTMLAERIRRSAPLAAPGR